MTHLDLSGNNISGEQGGKAVASLLMRKIKSRGGRELEVLNLANNKLGDKGFAALIHELLLPDNSVKTLNVARNGVE